MRSRCCQHISHAVERTQQNSLLRLRPPPLVQSRVQRRNAASATSSERDNLAVPRSLQIASQARHNEIGVQQVSAHIYPQLFPNGATPTSKPDAELIALSRDHLARHELLGKTSDKSAPIAFDLPQLHGSTLDEHFYRLGMDSAEPYLSLAQDYAKASPPPKPRKWERRSGWTKYYPDGKTEAVEYPDAQMLTFDIEVMWRETNFPAMACAVSAKNWYCWISPWLLQETDDDRHLIPLGDPKEPRIIVGHNVGYDRARITEEYSMEQSKNFFLDTMSLHVAVNGMCSRQRPTWMKHRKQREMQEQIASDHENGELSSVLQAAESFDEEEELWVGRASVNSLRDVARFHCGVTIDKAKREWFGELDREGIVGRLDELLDYCAADVEITHRVYKKVFPLFVETCPHPVSFAALRHLASEILPVDKSWEAYIKNAEATYHRLSSDVQERLVDLAEKALEHKTMPSVVENDPWLSQLDWSGQEIRMLKPKKKGEEPRPAANQKKPGMPKWYKDLFATKDADISLTVRTRIAPLLLRMAWDGHPLVWSNQYGWTFKVLNNDAQTYVDQAMTRCDDLGEDDRALMLDRNHTYFKLPHRDGPAARCVSPLAKGYLQFFEKGTLASEYAYAREALDMNASCSYWISARDRIMSQMVVFDGERADSSGDEKGIGYILPQVVPMGTITRRAVENTWLTASNAKKNRVGSELKSMITAPPGYSFVGADVDSEELWIASLVGDASFKLHGGNAIGFMTLEGAKALGTDLHSRTAKTLGISRNDAKVFNYGRIYGAGLKFAQTLLRQFNPLLKEQDAARIAGNLYTETKGAKSRRSSALRPRAFWHGGTESFVFNRLEDFAQLEKPRTPVLGAGITEALMRRFINKSGDFMTSRINWAIQSSGVDYLHLLIVSMEYLCKRYNIDARVALTVHDEIRYLAKTEDKYRCAMALQVANVWTRAMFSQQMGIDDLPQACAFFSAVDIDHVLRKEVDMDCITPSHPDVIPPGESLDIYQLLALGEKAHLDPAEVPISPPTLDQWTYTPRPSVMSTLESPNALHYLRAQIASTPAELDGIVKELKAPTPTKKTLTAALKPNANGPATDADVAPKKPRGRKPKTSSSGSTSATGSLRRSSSSAISMQASALARRAREDVGLANWYAMANKDHDLSRSWGNGTGAVDVGLMKRVGAGRSSAWAR